MSEQLEQAAGLADERRRNQRSRAAFDSAFVMIEPFFDPGQGWGGSRWNFWRTVSCARIFPN
jgi:hypothetical protein